MIFRKRISGWELALLVGLVAVGCNRKSPTSSRTRAPVAAESTVPPPSATQSAVSATNNPAVDFTLPTYEIKIEGKNLTGFENSAFSNETVPATFLVKGVAYEGARVRYRGAWARGWPKKPMKVFFPKDDRFEDARCVNLNSAWRDPAFIREPLAYYIYSACGAIASRAKLVRVDLNGNFRGLYVDVEQPDKPLLKRHDLAGAAIYKANSPSNQADERDFPNLATFTHHYEKQTRKTEDYADLQQFCHELANTRDVPGFFNQRVDVDHYINFLAATVLVQNWDGFNKNHYLLHDVKGSGKWLPLPWDLDRTLGDHWDQTFSEAHLPILLGTRAQAGITGWNRLADRFLGQPELRGRFLERLEQLLETEFTEARLFPVLDQFESEIHEWQQAEVKRWPRFQPDFHKGIQGVRSFIQNRRAYLLREVKGMRSRGSSI